MNGSANFSNFSNIYRATATRLAYVVIVLNFAGQYIYNASTGDFTTANIRTIASVLMALASAFIGNSSKINDRILAIVLPSVMGLISLTSAVLAPDGSIFWFLLGCAVISLLCLQPRSLIAYLLLINVVVAMLILLRVPFTMTEYSSSNSVVTHISFILTSIMLCITDYYFSQKVHEFEKTSRTFDIIMNNTPNHMIIIGDEMRISYISKTLAQWLGMAHPWHAKNLPLLDLFPTNELKRLFSDLVEINEDFETSFSITMDERQYWFILRSTRLDAKTNSRLMEWSDITPIMEAKHTAERATKSKSEFLARMSHEIRTPLNAIMGMSELILRENLPKKAGEFATVVNSASTTLLSLINDILDFSKIESGKMEIVESPYDLASMINDIVSIIRTRLVDKPLLFIVNLDSKLPSGLIGDEIRIRQIVLNLLNNAVKYTRKGYIKLNITGEKKGNILTLKFTVEDTGIGISPENIKRLFSTFVQIDVKKNKGIEGSGLGLAITKSLCNAMNGSVTVESIYGKGSEFTVMIPNKIETNTPIAKVEKAQEKSALIYEPRTEYGNSIEKTMTDLGVRVSLASSISQFAESLWNNYDYIFAPSFMVKNIRELMDDAKSTSRLILLGTTGEDVASAVGVPIISMPAYSANIASVLNDIDQFYNANSRRDSSARFIAPNARVLIVDDIRTNLMVAEGLMSPYAMKIDLCQSGKDAIDAVKRKQYDVIFMDHMMPELDGIETTAVIRTNNIPYCKNVPIIALTANAVSGMKDMFLANGMDDFLPKPIEIVKLSAILEKWIPTDKKRSYKPDEHPHRGDRIGDRIPEISGIDTGIGLNMIGGNAENYIKTLSVFYYDGRKKIPEIQHAVKNQNYQDFTINIHALKSALASIGADKLSKTARELEDAGRSQNIAFIFRKTPEFLDSLSELLENLAKVVVTDKSSNTENKASPPAEQTLSELKSALENTDIASIDMLMSILNSLSWDKNSKEIIQNIERDILLCEYDNAKKLIEQLVVKIHGK